MKTLMEIQHKEKNTVTDEITKLAKANLKDKGIKVTEVETLNIYFIPETNEAHYVATLKDGKEVKESVEL